LATSAAEAWALALALSIVRRILPHRSGAQLASAPTWNWREPPLDTTVPPETTDPPLPLPRPLQLAPAVRPSVGKSCARSAATMAWAWR